MSDSSKPSLSLNKVELKKLYEKIGGETQLMAILQDFYQAMANDILVGFFFAGKDLDPIISAQQKFLLRAMGAVPSYSGKPPAQAHLNLPPILEGHFDRRLRLLETTLARHGFSETEIQTWIAFENSFRSGIVT